MRNRFFSILALSILLGTGCSDAATDNGSPGIAGAGGSTSGAGQTGTGAAAGQGGSNVAGAPASGSGNTNGGTSSGGTSNGGSGGMAAGAAGVGGSSGAAQGGSGGAAPLDGKGLYEANCKACHAEQGAGGLLAPEIVHPVRDYSTWVVRNGRAQTTFPKPMDKWGTDKLSDAQLMLIFDYLDLPPQPTTGQALYADYCASCHGANGKGGPTMRDITNEVGKVLTQVRSGKNVGKFAMRRDYMPAFPASDISDAELMLIRDYVESL
jgi:mono/diheme cytochrome c family protein